MTISVTSDVAFVPPRNQVEVSVPAGNLMTNVAVFRNDSFGRSLVRTQPTAGFTSRTVFDYEAPYGQAVTYDWTATYYDPADNATTFSEPFTTWPGSWTGDTGDGSIASAALTFDDGSFANRSVTRAIGEAWDSITIASLASGAVPDIGGVKIITQNGGTAQVTLSEIGGTVRIFRQGAFAYSWLDTGIDASEEFVIVRASGGFALSGVGGSYLVASTTVGVEIASVNVTTVSNTLTTHTLGAFTVETFASPNNLAEQSSAATLTPTNAWIVAPQAPALSFPLSEHGLTAGVRGQSDVVNTSNTTIHRILGTSIPLTTTTGNRQADVTGLQISTNTADESTALRALLSPDLPLLINVPPSWVLGFPYGFYQAGDVSARRLDPTLNSPQRIYDLPLSRVRAPDVDVQNAGWSYAQLASTWANYTAVLNAYATYAELATDTRA